MRKKRNFYEGVSMQKSLNSFKSKAKLQVGKQSYTYFSLAEAEKNGLAGLSRLPTSLKVLLENLLRLEDNTFVHAKDMAALVEWTKTGKSDAEIAFMPSRVLMQDFTGVPAVVDLAAMRDAAVELGIDPERVNPLVPVDLVIDHSVDAVYAGTSTAFAQNVAREYEQNKERYEFIRWGQSSFDNFRVVPPGTGICHQVNLENLAQVVWTSVVDGETIAYPDSVYGTDSHTTMVNALAVVGWGVGGIEAEAAMLGQPSSMLIPDVIGVRLTGKPREGITATDIVLTLTQILRKKNVVGKFVEFFGSGLQYLSLEDRSTIANMAPEYGATIGFFPVDKATLSFMRTTGRTDERIALTEAYAKAQGMFCDENTPEPVFTDIVELDISTVEPSMAGPKRPQDRVALKNAGAELALALKKDFNKEPNAPRFSVSGTDYSIGHGDVTIAAITSCTNTSNPGVMVAAGLLAKKAAALGLKAKPWVKTSLAPGSKAVSEYLNSSGLQVELDKIGFNVVGYGCTTCIGNSGPLAAEISKAINEQDIVGAAVISGNRNFEGRVNPDVRANYLASPPLVVAYAIAGTVLTNLETDELGIGSNGKPVYLRDVWPTNQEITDVIREHVTVKTFKATADVFSGDAQWQAVSGGAGLTYKWPSSSTYVQKPPYFDNLDAIKAKVMPPVKNVNNARIIALFLDSITTDHISPAGNIRASAPAGLFLSEHQVAKADYNSYGARRGNHQIMMRGTFANIRIKNQMLDGVEGGVTKHFPSNEQMPIYDAAMKYEAEGVPLIVIAGKEYGTGSSRDWAAKGTALLGIRAVIAESFERIHRSNLVGMGVVPFTFEAGTSWQTLGLKGDETVTIEGLDTFKPRQTMTAVITKADGTVLNVPVLSRVDTTVEIEYLKAGGLLPFMLRQFKAAA
jgi:aconitate hydratase